MLGSTVASQLPEQNAVNLAERYRCGRSKNRLWVTYFRV